MTQIHVERLLRQELGLIVVRLGDAHGLAGRDDSRVNWSTTRRSSNCAKIGN